jgi:type III secretion protein J
MRRTSAFRALVPTLSVASPLASGHGEAGPLSAAPKTLATRVLGCALIAALLVGCAVPVAAGLDEPDANRVVVALDRAKIDAAKEADPGGEGKFRVNVARDDIARALSALQSEGLPRARPRGVLDTMDRGALVPSQAQEQAQLLAGLAGDLERTLEDVDGVLSARVHLNVPVKDPLRDVSTGKATASVLLEYRGTTPPLRNEEVQRLVAGGVGGLQPGDVALVTLSRVAPPRAAESELVHVGPLAVARGSLRPLQMALGALVVLLAAFAGATLLLYMRLARERALQAR